MASKLVIMATLLRGQIQFYQLGRRKKKQAMIIQMETQKVTAGRSQGSTDGRKRHTACPTQGLSLGLELPSRPFKGQLKPRPCPEP